MNIAHFQTNTAKNKRPWMFRGERLYRRIMLLVVAVITISIITNLWFQANQKGEEVLVAHTENLAQVIMAQAQHEARVWFINENREGLVSLAEHLQKQPSILEVSIQDNRGRNIVRVGHDQPVHEFLRQLPESMWAVPMVATVMDRDESGAQLLGFVRITFDYQRITAESRPYHRASLRQLALLIGLAFFAGAVVTFAFLRRRRAIPVAEYAASQNAAKTSAKKDE
ncbi:MAG: hypothetical protein LAT53_04345 [Idiomarina sp.]|nr:hypothetical protein [Idiomarina sp.]